MFRERLLIQWPGACHALHAGVCVVRACDASACARGRVCVAMGTPDPGEPSGLTECGQRALQKGGKHLFPESRPGILRAGV